MLHRLGELPRIGDVGALVLLPVIFPSANSIVGNRKDNELGGSMGLAA